jgi:hypothetical protein
VHSFTYSVLGENELKKLSLLAIACCAFFAAAAAFGQQMDFAFGVGTVNAPSYSPSSTTNPYFPPVSLTGGAYPSISGDFLLHKNFGVMGEISWRASEAIYNGYQPYRPIFWDFNGVYVPQLTKHVAAELSAGIGAESTRFYTNYYTCNYVSCTNYATSTHFLGQFGAGLKLYPKGGFFFRPEIHYYLVNNNSEYTSSRVFRYGASIGYTFGAR